MKKILITLAVIANLSLLPLLGVQTAHADFISCMAEGNNITVCLDESNQGGTTTSFVDYGGGGLAPPSKEGYSAQLTQAGDARTLILNITNFALGFLALIAVVIIIYGGFMYVTAAGKEDQAGKGKKSISYAIIGILIILGSFAIVNTVLQAPGGTEGATKGSAGQGGTSGTVPLRFNALANRVSVMAQDLVTAFEYHFAAQIDLESISTMMGCAASKSCSTIAEFSSAVDGAIGLIDPIKNKVTDKTVDSIYIKTTLDDLKAYLAKFRGDNVAKATADAAAVESVDVKDCVIPGPVPVMDQDCRDEKNAENADAKANAVKAALQKAEYDKTYYEKAQTAVTSNFTSTVRSQKSSFRDIYLLVRPITDVADTQFNDLVALEFLQQEQVLTKPEEVDLAGGQLMKLADDVSGSTTLETTNTDELYATLKLYSALYAVLKDLKFVDARITASVTEGNSPLVVNFDNIGSMDPSGLTIQDSQVEWDLNGDGKYNGGNVIAFSEEEKVTIARAHAAPSSPGSGIASASKSAGASVVASGMGSAIGGKFMNCEELAKATVSCTYLQPGTYRVSLRIKPSGTKNEVTGKFYSEEIGTGVSTITIKVNPPQTKIRLSVDNVLENNYPYYMIDYDDDGFLTTSRGSVIVQASKAMSSPGVLFNAQLTDGIDGPFKEQGNEGATIRWDFGDESTDGINKAILPPTIDNLAPKHVYEKMGSYTVTAEFTDKNKISDRKIFTLDVSSIAPVYQITPDEVRVNDEVTFDGSSSAADNSPITFLWDIKPSGNVPLPADLQAKLKDESFKYTFTKPATYIVSLQIKDSLGDQKSTLDQTIVVSSKPPVSQFAYSTPDKTQPGTVLLDGTKSYDPDGLVGTAMAYQWEINGQKVASTSDFEFVDGASGLTSAKAKVKFKKIGTYAVTLVATDPGETTVGNEVPMEKEVVIDNVLDIAWGTGTNTSTVLKVTETGTTSTPPVTINLLSSAAVAYEIDFGDSEKEQGDMPLKAPIVHNYKEAGTYVIKASVFDAEDNENILSRKAYVGSSTKPVAVIGVKINGQELIPTPGESVIINRKDVVTFEASQSKNVDGTGRRLTYGWDLGDGEKSTKESINHTYKDIGNYKITLKTTNANDVSQSGTDTFDLAVKGEPPTLRSITAVPTGSTLTAPVTVLLNAVGAEDADGKITRYRWWYYDPSNDSDELGVQISTSPSVSVVIGTRGEEGQEKTYKFAVEMTDDESNTVSSRDILGESGAPSLAVTNGPNKSPVAKFNVDKTSIMVGESVEFSSASTDPDGTIAAYFWDWEGDGFANNTKDEGPNVTHVFNTAANDGIRVRLKVRDNFDSESTSDAVTIYVEGKAQPPLAAFISAQDGTTKKVKFTNNSTADTGNGINLSKYAWDFNTALDSNGDGKKDNDTDSTEKDPSYIYADYGIYRAKMTVTDSAGAKAEVTNYVNVKAPTGVVAPGVTPAATTNSKPVAAFISTQDGTTKKVKFTNNSTADTAKKISLSKFVWDFNTALDSNGDAKKDNDIDSTVKDPSYEYSAYGLYRVKLTVTDSAGVIAEVTNPVEVKSTQTPAVTPVVTPAVKPAAPTLDARLLTTPAPSFVDSKVHLTGDSGNVIFDFSTSTGNIKKFIIDKNVYFDTNGNGNKMDDEDYTATIPGKWSTNYLKSFGQTRARLTVVDEAGKTDYVEKDIVFDTTAGSTFLADVFNSDDVGFASVFVCIAAFGILSLKKLILHINKQK